MSYVHKLWGLHDPPKSFLIPKLLTALSRRQTVDIRLPVTRPVLHELVRALSFTNSSAFQRALLSSHLDPFENKTSYTKMFTAVFEFC